MFADIIQKDVYNRKPAEVIPEMMLGYKIDTEYDPSLLVLYPIYYERDEAGLPPNQAFCSDWFAQSWLEIRVTGWEQKFDNNCKNRKEIESHERKDTMQWFFLLINGMWFMYRENHENHEKT